MKTTFTAFIFIIFVSAMQAGPLKRPLPSFEHSFYYWKSSQNTTSYWLLFPPMPDTEVIVYLVLTNDEGKSLGKFALREMSYKNKDGKEMVKYSVSCLSDDLISSTTYFNLMVKNNEITGKDGWFQLPLKAAKLRSKGKP